MRQPDAPSAPKHAPPRFRLQRLQAGPWIQVASLSSFEWNRFDLFFDRLPPPLEGLRIVHLSDLHVRRRWEAAYDLLVDKLRADPPDLIAITGDFVEHRSNYRRTLPTLQRLMTQLPSRHGIYGILGNHDGDLLGPRLREWGVHIICGRAARLESDVAVIELIGVPSVSRRDVSPQFAGQLPQRADGAVRIALTHFPDSIMKLAQLDADLVLAGHTHGGQVCLPGGIPIVTHDSLPRRMCHGAHPIDGKLLVVNRGLGFASVPMRLFCPPEVVEIRFGNVKLETSM